MRRTCWLKPNEVYIQQRENPIVNRLNKTKQERVVDHEQERVDRIKKENAAKRAIAAEKVSNNEIRCSLSFVKV